MVCFRKCRRQSCARRHEFVPDRRRQIAPLELAGEAGGQHGLLPGPDHRTVITGTPEQRLQFTTGICWRRHDWSDVRHESGRKRPHDRRNDAFDLVAGEFEKQQRESFIGAQYRHRLAPTIEGDCTKQHSVFRNCVQRSGRLYADSTCIPFDVGTGCLRRRRDFKKPGCFARPQLRQLARFRDGRFRVRIGIIFDDSAVVNVTNGNQCSGDEDTVHVVRNAAAAEATFAVPPVADAFTCPQGNQIAPVGVPRKGIRRRYDKAKVP